jgi:hypothetical protein
MDVETIDREYQQLEQEAQLVGQSIQALAEKLNTAGDAGDANAKSWVLDLKSLALQIQQEQLQVQSLLQALHDFAVNSMQAQPAAAGYAVRDAAPAAAPVAQLQPQPQTQAAAAPDHGGGMLHRFLAGNLGQAVATGAGIGAGFGVTDSLISSIFQ